MLNWGMVTRKNTFCILSQPASVTPMNNQWFSPYPWVLGSPKFKWVGGWIFPCFLAKSLWITINPMNSNETSISSPCIAIIFLYIYIVFHILANFILSCLSKFYWFSPLDAGSNPVIDLILALGIASSCDHGIAVGGFSAVHSQQLREIWERSGCGNYSDWGI